MKKQVKYISAGMLAGMLLCGGQMQAANTMSGMHVCVTDAIQKDNRPEVSKRLFRSNAVEKEIIRVQKLLKTRNWHGCSQTVSPIPSTLPYTSAKARMANRTHSFIRATFTQCGFVIRVRRYGRMCSWQTPIPN